MTTRAAPGATVDVMSNHKNPGGAWPRMAALAVMAGVILLVSGCGGSSSSSPDGSSSPGSSNAAKAVAYSNCMRAHGVDVSVNSNGNLSSGSSGSGSGGAGQQTVQAAQTACRHLLPNGGQPSQAAQEKQLEQALKYTQCMRAHGVPNFPDPTRGPNGLYGYHIPNGSGINPQSATYQKASQACQSSA
jgi:hypothetical protein